MATDQLSNHVGSTLRMDPPRDSAKSKLLDLDFSLPELSILAELSLSSKPTKEEVQQFEELHKKPISTASPSSVINPHTTKYSLSDLLISSDKLSNDEVNAFLDSLLGPSKPSSYGFLTPTLDFEPKPLAPPQSTKKEYRDAISGAKEIQRQARMELATTYETGQYQPTHSTPVQLVPRDSWHSSRYIAKATGEQFDETPWTLRTQTLYAGLNWYHAIRLTFVRIVKVCKAFGHTRFIHSCSKGGFPLDFIGVSYAIDLLVDFAVLAKAAWNGHFMETLCKDDRPVRMANAGVWLTVNAICAAATAGTIHLAGLITASFLTGVACAFDVAVEIYTKLRDKHHHLNCKEKISKRIKLLEAQLELGNYLIQKELAELRALLLSLNNKIEATERFHEKAISVAFIVGACMMVLEYLPGKIHHAAIKTAALVMFFAGCVLMGLGRLIFNTIKESVEKYNLRKEQEKALLAPQPAALPAPANIVTTKMEKLPSIAVILSKLEKNRDKAVATKLSMLTLAETMHLKKQLGLTMPGAWEYRVKLWSDCESARHKNSYSFFSPKKGTLSLIDTVRQLDRSARPASRPLSPSLSRA